MSVILSHDDSIKRVEGKEPGHGKIIVHLREVHSGVVKSPQYGLILAKSVDQDPGNSHKIANYRSIFLQSRIFGVFRGNRHY
jgi:hypothetical protein